MSEDNKEGYKLYNKLLNIRYDHNDRYGITYLNPQSLNKYLDILSNLRRIKYMVPEDISVLVKIAKIHGRNYHRISYLQDQELRTIAQRFISKKNVRNMIFKRDNYQCLRCGIKDGLSIDHINPISKGGENKIGNLQTLCVSCNSYKGVQFKDFR